MNKLKKLPAEQTASLEKFSPDVLADISELFSKRFSYTKPPDDAWRLPDSGDAFTQDHEEFNSLLVLKDSLNEVKNLLSDKKLDEWHQHTSFTNKAGKIIPHVKKSVNAELCTQAWCKFHEILCSFPLIPQEAFQNGELNSVHLCEAPGAFIASLNHYLKSHHIPCDWNWVANTLNPYHEANDNVTMIMDDRLIADTLPRWYFGPENTGDVMTLKHLSGLQRFVGDMATVHLVTADGSFDCQGNPGEQEALVSPLHYCEVVTALMILGSGGSLVLKMFTLFEHCSVNLLYLLNCSFEEVHVFKPGTSKAGNSEVYVVCLNFLGREAIHPLLTKMMQNFEAEKVGKALFPRHAIPGSFLKCHEECCAFFHRSQLETISENIRLFESMGEEEQAKLNDLRDCAVEVFMLKFQVKPLARSNWLVKKSNIGCSVNTKWFRQRNRYFGTYNERKMLETLSWADKLAKGYFDRWVEEHALISSGQSCILEGSPSDLQCHSWSVLEGEKLPRVKCSPFCDGEILKTLNEALEKSFGDASSLGRKGPPCRSCRVLSGDLVFSELLNLTPSLPDSSAEGTGARIKCVVVGLPSLCDVKSRVYAEVRLLDSAPLLPFSCSLLHDGEPRYQRQLLDCLLCSLPQLHPGDALILPVLSCFTRFSAGLVFILHHCFGSIAFACPVSSEPLGSCAVLLCVGYRALPSPVVRYLRNLSQLTRDLIDSDASRQVLQFVPMEAVLKGALLEFLWDLNTAIAKRQLHLIVQGQQQDEASRLRL
ncbi:cap-specific mRNA (nucleoside-2'-O-)-methyltransferase 2 [Ornithorhynchus anatinus]|uniref:Cap-specific mRNA (nucleoside-2'-O-)-methyltransferase 2 n=1 Tax=Ornithorhynchus anatinus TaxID=9258 RepID=A0A6I8NHU0_ORNAN|nr:cap-specific mRNA (nucleoside-2'-O-)-methyltransferase 2 [Ornithorhynchus anatinus]